MFKDLTSLQTALMTTDPRSFVSNYIIEPVPYAFHGDFAGWLDWKKCLAEFLEVDPYDIVMTGSAALGFSLNPQKGFKGFGAGSDFDCAVISSHYFDVAWRFLRQSQVSWLSYPKSTKTALRSHRTQYIFDGTIATDRILGLLPFGKTWLTALETVSTTGPVNGRDVKIRIYKDFDALRQYQAKNIETLRNLIGSQDKDDTELEQSIPIEDEK